eukprot:6180590-Pleurochrysis_carterae.AAC.5
MGEVATAAMTPEAQPTQKEVASDGGVPGASSLRARAGARAERASSCGRQGSMRAVGLGASGMPMPVQRPARARPVRR